LPARTTRSGELSPAQEVTIAGRLERHGAGVRLSSTTPAALADAIVANLGDDVSYAPPAVNGARLTAQRVLERAGAPSAAAGRWKDRHATHS
jgi:hypothetical protein